jgi:tRNA nucleotidyltransferase (CCA-adding enzyme)
MDVLARLREHSGYLLDAFDGEPRVHVVGGAVRDALLGREPRELDFVVEGEAAPLARRVAERLGAEVTEHPDFATATVRVAPRGDGAGEGPVFDITSARSERYAHPGALPTVTLGVPLQEDLRRRDFTVNAMAVALADGRLTELPQAREDLENRVLRILHDRSFVDDPTRLLRLARYGARLAFRTEAETDDLARAAIRGGLLSVVSGHRVGDELRLLLREPMPAALEALNARGLGDALFCGMEPHALALEHAREVLPPDGRPDLLALASMTLDTPGLAELLEHYEFAARDRDTVVAAATRSRALAQELDQAAMVVPSRLARRLRAERPETVALAGALGGSTATRSARHWLQQLRHVKLDIGGDDLLAAGLNGPAIGVALQAALDARLDGRAPGREEQLAAALASAA